MTQFNFSPTGLGTSAARIRPLPEGVHRSRNLNTAPLFRLPDFSRPFPVRLNPQIDAIRQPTTEWAREMGMLSELWGQAKFDAADFALYGACTHPVASRRNLILATEWGIWGFFIDDYILATYKQPRDLQGLRRYVARMQSLAPAGLHPAPVPIDPAERGLDDLWRRTAAGLSHENRCILANSLRIYVESFISELINDITSHAPDPITYLEMRRRTFAADLYSDLATFLQDANITSDAYHSTAVRKLREIFGDSGGISNDIISYQKEKGVEENNIVMVMERFFNVDTQRAMDTANDLITARLREFEHITETEIPSLPTGSHSTPRACQNAENYAQRLRDWMAGCLHWQLRTARFPMAGTTHPTTATGRLHGPPGRLQGPHGLGTSAAKLGQAMTDTDRNTALSGQHAIVVGAGLAGLTAAFRLRQAGAHVTVLEASDRIGGHVQTECKGDFLIDTGASVFRSTYRHMLQLIHDAGLSDQIMATGGPVGFLRDQKIHCVEGDLAQWFQHSNFLSPRARRTMNNLMQDIDSAGDTLSFTDLSQATALDDSADSYSRRRLDDELLEQVIEPLSSSCLADAEQVAAAVPLFALRHFIGAGNFNSDQGVQFLPQGLAKHLDVRCRTPVLHVAERADEVAVTWRHEDGCEKTTTADVCILAVPGWAIPTVFPQLSPAGLAYFSCLRYATGMAVFLGLDNRPATPVSWINVPRHDLPDSAGIILDHNRAPGRAPESKALIATYWQSRWGRARMSRTDEEIVDDVVEAVDRLKVFPRLTDHIEMVHVQRWSKCVPIRHPGSTRQLAEFTASMNPTSRIRLAGAYFSVATTNTAIASAERAAEEAIRIAAQT